MEVRIHGDTSKRANVYMRIRRFAQMAIGIYEHMKARKIQQPQNTRKNKKMVK